MITVNGKQYRTLSQKILDENGKQVLAVYANGRLVYPERDDTMLLKVTGHINTLVTHDHTGENPSCVANGGSPVYTYYGGGTYRAKGCFSLVIRNHSYQGYPVSSLSFLENTRTIPAAKYPLDGSYSAGASSGDIEGPGNAWVVFPYSGSTAPLYPNGDGVHPLLGSDAIETHAILKGGNLRRPVYSVEMLLHLDVSAPVICPWRTGNKDLVYYSETVPVHPYLDELPADVNGFHRLSAYRRDSGFGFQWNIRGQSGTSFTVRLANSSYNAYATFSSHVKIISGDSGSDGYRIPYVVRTVNQGVTTETAKTYRQAFRILNIPITDLVYSGPESDAPEAHLHPAVSDIEQYI